MHLRFGLRRSTLRKVKLTQCQVSLHRLRIHLNGVAVSGFGRRKLAIGEIDRPQTYIVFDTLRSKVNRFLELRDCLRFVASQSVFLTQDFVCSGILRVCCEYLVSR